ncbi:MAG TPA: MgtC/SapB family protein [Candidatus Binatia bacterium]|jgi:putative Mg2+ transporter-C (MgtC) family protein|nr:MgtC/SapB family protein [Candidatus Binatia bacterium]
MDIILEEMFSGLPDLRQMVSLVSRLLTAMILGALVGAQRESIGKPAGLRTHMLVAMGSALFVLAPLEAGMELDGISRVIQGIVTGIGFIGAGAILKLQEKREIEGLTTAAGIWMTAAIGIAAGLGRWGLALVSTILTWITLSVIGKIETWMNQKP